MKLRHLLLSTAFGLAAMATITQAAVVGHNTPANALSTERLNEPGAQPRAAWADYIARSKAQMTADKAALAAELKPGETAPPAPTEGRGGGAAMPLDHYPEWYATPEARHIADVIVSFQTPAGGWGKNQARNGAPRLPGQPFVADNVSKFLAADDYDTPKDPHWNYVGTLDNDATTTELRFLAKVSGQTPGKDGEAYRSSFLRGLHYLLNAQYPNGGWPQVWPLEGGYHDAITYNDNAVTLAAEVLSSAATGQGDYAFVPTDLRQTAAKAASHAVDVILATQIRVNGRLTLWGQQYDPLSLQAVSARNFEPPSISTEESADLLLYLMQRPNPSPAIIASIKAGVAWLQSHELHDVAWTRGANGRTLVAQSGAPTLWARYYDVVTEKPVFGDRDKTVHDDVNDLTLERRNGYAWFNTEPKKALDAYVDWSQKYKD